MLHILVECKHIDDAVCDDTLREFRDVCDMARCHTAFREFDPNTELTAFSTRQWGVSHLFAECGI